MSEVWRSRDRRRALWVTADGSNHLASLRDALGEAGGVLDELIWIDLRTADAEGLEVDALARQVTKVSADQLQAQLDTNDDLAPWSTDRASPPQLSPADPLWAWMTADLLAEQYVGMPASGGDRARNTSLRRVFTDLPLVRSDQFTFDGLPANGQVYRLRRWYPATTGTFAARLFWVGRQLHGCAQRLLLVGGPGQGKSTLGQYVCQAHRAALLRAYRAPLREEAAALVGELAELADQVGCQRLPLFVTLHQFADALAAGQVGSVQEWLVSRANQRIQGELITVAHLDGWLARWPSLVVFDGLDEVPPSANRGPMLQVIRQFLAEFKDCDLIAVASTRPQGYRDELQDWVTLELADLGPKQVRTYGEKLYTSWVPHDPTRRDELLSRLEKATREPVTAHLTRSPLQVLILATLIEQSGSPPRERWRLFREYFRIILDRERERQFAAVQVLRDHQDLIERLHAELGYRAQLAGELAGGTSDGLRRADVVQVVRELLEQDHHPPERIEELVDQVDRAVFDRLVFLCGEGDDRVRFEVRSLQEFFAAERLFFGEESLLPRRLEGIAGSVHWRNVLLFMVGRLVVERPHLQDRVLPLCDRVDGANDGLGGLAGVGLRLALWLLQDGAVAGKPRLVEPLLARVLERIDELDESDLLLLGGVQGDWGRTKLVPRLIEAASGGGEDAASLCLRLLEMAGEQDRLERALREQEPWAILALRSVVVRGVSPEVQAYAKLARRALPLREALRIRLETRASELDDGWHWGGGAAGSSGRVWWNQLRHFERSPVTTDTGPATPDWGVLEPWAAFVRAPNPASLASLLESARRCGAVDAIREFGPWPAAALLSVPDQEQAEVIERARRGEYGDAAVWRAASERWRQGQSAEDWVEALLDPAPVPAKVATVGWPLGLHLEASLQGRARDLCRKLSRPEVREAVRVWFEWRLLLDAPAASQEERGISWTDPGLFLEPSLVGHGMPRLGPLGTELAGLTSIGLRVHLDRRWSRSEEWAAHLAEIACWTVREGIRVLLTDDGQSLGSWLRSNAGERPWLYRWWLEFDTFEEADYRTVPTAFDDDHLTWVAHLVRAPLLTAEEVPGLVDWMSAHREASAWALARFPERLAEHAPPGALPLLRALLERGLGDPRTLRLTLRHLLAAHPTALHAPSVARDHGLPLPLTRSVPARLSEDPLQPLHLAEIQVENLRVWEAATLKLDAPVAQDQGSWLFLIGANGVGKTTFLRGLALCLLPPATADLLLAQLPGSLVAQGAEEARVQVTWRDGRKASARVRGAQVVPNGRPPDVFFVGYGPRRGTLLGVTRQEVRFEAAEAVETLFVEGGNLIHATSWLKDLYTGKLESPGGEDEQILDAVLLALKRVLPRVSAVEVSKVGVTVRQGSGEMLPLEAMSDGYLTTAGWILDLIARWVHRQRGRGLSISGDFLSRMTGLVLIDEIDLHLHPRWQWEVVEELRELFPRMSFVATTHHPITLLGARPGEVAVIDVDERARSSATLRDIPYGTNAEELLTGPWFGLPSTVDRDTLRLLDEQRALLRTRADPERLAQLDQELAARLRRPHAVGDERKEEVKKAAERRQRLSELSAEEREQRRLLAIERLREAFRS